MNKPRDFWSRRRAGVEAEAEAHEALQAETQLAERPDEELLAELDLPEPENLDSPDAVQEFLKAELPQRLKTRALRRLWRLNPVLANLDGLVDYGEDYTDAATVIENMQTVYQVGKGMVTAFLEEETDDEQGETDPVEDLPADGIGDETVSEDESPLVASRTPLLDETLPAPPAIPAPDTQPEPVAMPQRRMRFAFDTA